MQRLNISNPMVEVKIASAIVAFRKYKGCMGNDILYSFNFKP
jgi:hypothetical protein